MLTGREFTVLMPNRDAAWAPTARLGSMFGYGVSLRDRVVVVHGWPVPCCYQRHLPRRFGARRAARLPGLRCGNGPGGRRGGDRGGAGGYGGDHRRAAAAALRQPRRRRAAGHRGLYVAYYGVYEFRLFEANGNPSDPVIAAVGRLEGVLARWVHQHGAWPWFLALLALVLVAVAWGWRGRVGRGWRARFRR